MSGHNKWSTIKHKKGKEDARRGKIKHYMAALLLTSMVWSGHAQEKNEMDF